MKKVIFIFFCYLSLAKSSEIFESNRSLRSLGMGGAYIAIVQAQDAPLINPAALGFVKELKWEMANIGAGINGLDIYNSASSFHTVSSASDYTQFYGKRIWVNAAARTSLVMPNFGIAAFDEFTADFTLHNPAYPQFNMDFLNDYGIDIAGAVALGNESYVGLGVKRVYRWGGNQDIGLGIIASGNAQQIIDSFQNKGVGYGIDLAYIAKIPGLFDSRFTAVWQDVGDTQFSMTAGTAAPASIKNNLSVGYGSLLDLPGIDMSADVEVRHIMNTEYSFGQKVHMGAELSLPLVDVRAGLSQGYPTYGIGFSFLFMDFDAAYYFTELGAYPGQTPENRIQLGLSFGASVDADFNMYSRDGKKRKLKQRR